jgi:PhoPQ-activated pathogenicity-related protein
MNSTCDACDSLLANAVAISHSMQQIQQMAIIIMFLCTLVIVNISYTLHTKIQNIVHFARDIVEMYMSHPAHLDRSLYAGLVSTHVD